MSCASYETVPAEKLKDTPGIRLLKLNSADGRDAYYSIDLARCRELLTAAGAALHPGLRLRPPAPRPLRVRVLFLCTGNSARSQMAQALLEQMGEEAITAASAGSHPKPLHPDAVRVMGEHGIDISSRQSRHLSVVEGERFDYVITLCDRLREICPEFPGPAEVIHWSIPDPAAGGGGYLAFRAVAADLRTRIGFLLARLRLPVGRRDPDHPVRVPRLQRGGHRRTAGTQSLPRGVSSTQHMIITAP